MCLLTCCVNCHVLEGFWKIQYLRRHQRISRYAPPPVLLSGKFGALPLHLLSSTASRASASVSHHPTVRQSTRQRALAQAVRNNTSVLNICSTGITVTV